MMTLDGARLRTKEEAYPYLREKLGLPDWFGNNLDALYDCLTSRGEDVTLCLENWPESGFAAGFLPDLSSFAAMSITSRISFIMVFGTIPWSALYFICISRRRFVSFIACSMLSVTVSAYIMT